MTRRGWSVPVVWRFGFVLLVPAVVLLIVWGSR